MILDMRQVDGEECVEKVRRLKLRRSSGLLVLVVILVCAGCLLEPSTEEREESGGAVGNHWDEDVGVSDVGDSGESEGGESEGEEPGGGQEEVREDPCEEIICGANAVCTGGVCACSEGFEGDPDAGCVAPSPCGVEGCEYGAYCDQGLCRCKFGFTATEEGCSRDAPTDPAMRSHEEVCSMWEGMSHPSASRWEVEPQETCEWGRLDSVYHNNVMTELNLYRWLVGLAAVGSRNDWREITQACATVLAGENAGLTHSPAPSYACYTQEGASGAASSNIVMGTTALGSVRVYIEDWNVPSMGHRRWALNPRAVDSAFGERGSYSCMYALSGGGNHNPEFTAYPAAGYFPVSALVGKWSLASSSWGLNGEVEIEIERLSDGEVIATHSVSYHPPDSLRPPMVSFRPVAALSREVAHEVRFSNLSGSESERSYRVTLTDC